VGLTWTWNGTTWDVEGGGGAAGPDGCYVGDTPPAGAEPGWLWWNSAEGILYVWYDDGDTQQWVEASPGGGGGGSGEPVTPIVAGEGLTGGTISDTGTVALDTVYTDGRYVNVTGDTMTGDLIIEKTIDGFAAVVIKNAATTSQALSAVQLVTGGSSWELACRSPGATNRPGWLGISFNGVTQAGFTKEGAFRVGVGDDFQNVGNIYSASSGAVPCFTLRNTAAPSTKAWSINADGGNSLTILNNGNTGVFISDGATAWSAFSDANLKQVTGGFPTAAEDVKALNPVRFTWKDDATERPCVGLIAQDVQKVLPEAVTVGPGGSLAVAYTDVIPLLTAALQDALSRIEALEAL
jgi:hypothetical protein